ncbi:hypothetical protein UFOVP404_24 [uncultured Caudovirales phage]|uniref:Uncharacterized protein n=1 Tax=uncultured Caudovirales phage TaxID=2100421 RepID=A0A6J5M3F4_9CAUD|nr:hypothetical protein UFOVP404_24 [uncultured Caudovirales phage]
MPSTEAPISITVKTPAGSLVTVRAESGDELDNIIALSVHAIASAAQELESAVRGTPAPTAQSVAAAFNGNIIETGTTIPAQEYAQPPQVPTIGGRSCPHGKMTAIQGMGKDGKPYKGWFCPAPKGAFDKCKNQYVTVQSPEWNTFVPEQIK